jgi:hypothetical protein
MDHDRNRSDLELNNTAILSEASERVFGRCHSSWLGPAEGIGLRPLGTYWTRTPSSSTCADICRTLTEEQCSLIPMGHLAFASWKKAAERSRLGKHLCRRTEGCIENKPRRGASVHGPDRHKTARHQGQLQWEGPDRMQRGRLMGNCFREQAPKWGRGGGLSRCCPRGELPILRSSRDMVWRLK